MGVHEECGVLGLVGPEPFDCAQLAYYGLYALQHRGQESCGVVVCADGAFAAHKDLGLVGEVFTAPVLAGMPCGTMAVGHVRYGTTGATNRANCQPIQVNHRHGKLAVAHNGNLSNAGELREQLEMDGAIFHTTSDTETIAYVVTRERMHAPALEDALTRAMNVLAGAYSLVLMAADKLVCARDTYGFRPLCLGKREDGIWVAASESCALAAVGAAFVRDVEPGEIVVLDVPEGSGEVRVVSHREHCVSAPVRHCAFEYIYFARPDSVVDGVAVHGARVRAGEILAREHAVLADAVIGVPDSGLDAALGYARESGIPYTVGLIKNKYIGRTFIAPEGGKGGAGSGSNSGRGGGASDGGSKHDIGGGKGVGATRGDLTDGGSRVDKVRIKLAAVEENVRGKRIVLVDDSIVRGTTAARLVALLRDAGAAEIHLRISAPPFLHPCYYGTDIDSEEHLIANTHTVPEIADALGVDSLGYLPLGALAEMVGSHGYCDACFSGNYPTAVPHTRKDAFE